MVDAKVVTPRLLRSWPLPQPGDDQSKGSKHERGHVLIVGGARKTPGAVLLAGLAALRCGAGVLAMAVPDAVAVPLAVAVPESGVTGWKGKSKLEDSDVEALGGLVAAADAVVVGPGFDDAAMAENVLAVVVAALEGSTPVLLDAYAIGVLAQRPDLAEQLAGRLVVTPNGSEAERLIADADTLDPQSAAEQIARRWSATVSSAGMVAGADAGVADTKTYTVESGHAGLGTSGSGDVLAGAIGGLLARGCDLAQATCWGTYLHAAAGDRLAARVGPLGFLARELLDELPLVLAELNA